LIEDHADRQARLAARLWRAVEVGSISRRGMLQVLALAAGSAFPAGRALASSLAEPRAAACGDTAGLPPSPDCRADRLIVKPIPAERFRILGAGSAEMRWDRLSGSDYRVPTKDFYVHNRSCPPRFDPATWRLTVEGDALPRPLELTSDQFARLPHERIVRVLDCAANGRAFFANDRYLHPPTPFVPDPAGSWRLGAVGAAEWGGVPLGEVLERAGLLRSGGRPVASEVQVESVERLGGVAVTRVVPLAKAMAGDSLLADAMNGEPLSIDHGAPIRALFSGWAGIANVKWVRRIVVSKQPIYSFWDAHHAVLVGPDYEPGWDAFRKEYGTPAADALRHAWGSPVTVQNVKSAFELGWGAQLPRGRQVLRGRSWSGKGAIREVAVSFDGGQGWREARLVPPNPSLSWVRWEVEWDATAGDHLLIARARDTAGRIQVAVADPDQLPAFNKFGLMFGDRPGGGDSHNAVPHPVTVR
jgi:sulfane dehydrogenase subunit SoxC